MKKKRLNRTLKQTVLALPAAALMLGASQAGTIGIHYTLDWGAYAANGDGTDTGSAGTYGFYHYAYMTTGMNVTGTAFGVPATNWTNIALQYYHEVNTTNVVGQMTIVSTAKVAWSSGIGDTNFDVSNWYSWFEPAAVAPGNDEVTWTYLDDFVRPGSYIMWNVNVSGLRAAYPKGYTVQTIGYPAVFPAPNVNITDSATFTNSLAYTDLGERRGAWTNVHAGFSAVSPVMTSDVINIYGDPPVGDKDNPPIHHSTLCGFIIAEPLTLSIAGTNLVWSAGTLQSSPALGADAQWTTLTNAVSPYPFLPPTDPKMFYRLTSGTP